MSSQRVTAILVVHDGATWLPEVVASIASQTRKADQIVAIDTGSIDSSAKLLKGARIPVATLDREIGFGAAIAHGVAQLPTRCRTNQRSPAAQAHAQICERGASTNAQTWRPKYRPKTAPRAKPPKSLKRC